MRRRLYLMRHGDVAYFPDPANPVHPEEVVLTRAGIEQATAAGRALATVRFDRVITSGLPRTRRTAELVLEQLEDPSGAPEIESWPDLKEFRPGVLNEVPDEDLEEGFLLAFRGRPPHDASYMRGETVGSLVARVNEALDRLYAEEWETALAVLHGGVNRAILSWAVEGPGAYLAHFEQSPACINIIDGGPEFVVRGVNITPYDPAHLGSRLTTLEEMLAQYRDYRARGVDS